TSSHTRQLQALAQMVVDHNARTDVARKLAIVEHSRHARVDNPAISTVGPAQPIFHAEFPARLEAGKIGIQAALQVVRMYAFRPAVAKLLLHRAAAKFQPPA